MQDSGPYLGSARSKMISETMVNEMAEMLVVKNRPSKSRKQSGAYGYVELPNGRFKATLKVGKISVYIGTFNTDVEAGKAHTAAHKEWWG